MTFDFPRLLLVTLFVVVLTSSVNTQQYSGRALNQSSKNSENHTEPLVQNATKQDYSMASNSSIVHSSDAINDKKEVEWMEGESILMSFSTPQHENMATESTADKSNESKTRENVPKERDANPSVVARKGVKLSEEKVKIQASKGVDQGMNSDIFNNVTSTYTKSVETSSVTETAHINNQTETSNITLFKLDSSRSNNSLNYSINSNYSNTTLAPTNITIFHANTTVIHNITTTMPKTSSHIPKPKPTVTTVDGPEVNESRPSSRTKSSLGMPRKIDYIAPVIITIIALPILGAAIFMLYRRGRDCWDKRHYRRMDFLIDGMYND